MNRVYHADLVPMEPQRLSPERYCFSTTADGRIALALNRAEILRELAVLPSICVQVRQSNARLAVRLWSDTASQRIDWACLAWTPQAGDQGWADLERCACCDAPGRLRVFDGEEREYLQFCPPAGVDTQGWARVLAALQAPTRSTCPTWPLDAGLACAENPGRPLPVSSNQLSRLFLDYARVGEPICLELRTPQAVLQQTFVPETVEFDDIHLTVQGGDTGMVLGTTGPHRATVVHHHGDPWLWLEAVDQTGGLAVGPANGIRSRLVWQTLFRRTFA